MTILAILPDELSIEKQCQVLQAIAKYYPNVNVSLALETSLLADFVTGQKLNLTTLVSKDLTLSLEKVSRELTVQSLFQ